MLKAYKDLHIIYYCSALGMAALLAFIIFRHIDDYLLGFLLYCPLIFANALLLSVLLSQIAIKRLTKMMGLLDNCQAGAYLYAASQVAQKCSPSIYRQMHTYLTQGYSAIGDHATAITLTLQDLSQGFQPREWIFQVTLQSNLTAYYINAEEWDSARHTLEHLKRLVSDSRTIKNTSLLALMQNRILCYELAFAIHEGRGESVRATLEIQYNNAHTLYAKVTFAYQLATICLQMGDLENARGYLLFVQQNGGDTRFVGMAAAKLAELDAG